MCKLGFTSGDPFRIPWSKLLYWYQLFPNIPDYTGSCVCLKPKTLWPNHLFWTMKVTKLLNSYVGVQNWINPSENIWFHNYRIIIWLCNDKLPLVFYSNVWRHGTVRSMVWKSSIPTVRSNFQKPDQWAGRKFGDMGIL